MIRIEQQHIDDMVAAAHRDVADLGIVRPRATIITAAGAQTMQLGLAPAPADPVEQDAWFLSQLDARARLARAIAAADANEDDSLVAACMAPTNRDGSTGFGCVIAVGTVGGTLLDLFVLPIEFNEDGPNRLLDAVAVHLDGDREMGHYHA